VELKLVFVYRKETMMFQLDCNYMKKK